MTKIRWRDLSYPQKQAMREHFEEVSKYPRFDEQWVKYGTGHQPQSIKDALVAKGLIERCSLSPCDEDWFVLTASGIYLIMKHYRKKTKKYLKALSDK